MQYSPEMHQKRSIICKNCYIFRGCAPGPPGGPTAPQNPSWKFIASLETARLRSPSSLTLAVTSHKKSWIRPCFLRHWFHDFPFLLQTWTNAPLELTIVTITQNAQTTMAHFLVPVTTAGLVTERHVTVRCGNVFTYFYFISNTFTSKTRLKLASFEP